MGYQDNIAITGIATTADNKPSNGTVDGVDSFDTKKYPTVDPGTQKSIGEVDQNAKDGEGILNQGIVNAYLNNEQAFIVARNYLFINRVGTNGISGEKTTKQIYNENGKGLKFYELG